jgi:hypothetical protein
VSAARADQPAAGAAARDYTWVPLVEPSDTTVPDPPDGRWLVDENGLEYTLFRWPRHEGYYRFDDEQRKTVTLRYGMRLTVEHHDERYLYLRWYRIAPIRERLDAARAAAAADVAAIRAGYRTAIPERDALRLEPWDEGLPRAGQWRNGFAVADMNGDGHLDLAHGPPRKGPLAEPVIFLGDGAGHWRRWREARFPPLPYGYGDVAAADLDGDGQMDVVLAAHLTGLFALRGDGAGGFTAWSAGLPVRSRPAGRSPPPARGRPPASPVVRDAPPAGPLAFTSRALALADWNGDGRLDILALAEGPTSVRAVADGAAPALGKVIFLNRGDGSWQAVHGPGALMGDSILTVDLDGDGRLDFVTDSRVVGSADLLNYGEPGGTWRVAALPGARARMRAYAVAVADFDRDGRRDLAVSFQSQEGGEVRRGLDVYFGAAGEAGWRRVSVWAGEGTATDAMTALAAGDLDGDGHPDLVALTARGETWVFVNDGRGDFVLDRSPEADPGREHLYCAGYAARLVDLDGDGRAELVTAFAGEPGSEAMLRGILPARCRAEGALRAWKVVPGPASPGRDREP